MFCKRCKGIVFNFMMEFMWWLWQGGGRPGLRADEAILNLRVVIKPPPDFPHCCVR